MSFYTGAYFISRNILSSYQEGFYQYDAFFVRNTCITETYFQIMRSIIWNDTMGYETPNGLRISAAFDECTNNEIKIREIKKSSSGMF